MLNSPLPQSFNNTRCKVGDQSLTFECPVNNEQYTHNCPIETCTIDTGLLNGINIIPEINGETIDNGDHTYL